MILALLCLKPVVKILIEMQFVSLGPQKLFVLIFLVMGLNGPLMGLSNFLKIVMLTVYQILCLPLLIRYLKVLQIGEVLYVMVCGSHYGRHCEMLQSAVQNSSTVVVEQAAPQNVAGVLRITCDSQHFVHVMLSAGFELLNDPFVFNTSI